MINSGREDKLLYLNIRFLDGDGFVLAEDFANRQVSRGWNRDSFEGYRLIPPNHAAKISTADAKITNAIARVQN